LPLASAWVFRYNGTTFIDQLAERLSPSPDVVFFANIRNNADSELVLLRQARQELGPRARLIVRDGDNNDAIAVREELLDGDNEYKGGDGGDVDGDGRDEIVLVRNNRIRIYTEPESSTNFQLIERFTNGRTVQLGNVDAAGLAQRSRLSASRTSIRAVLGPGESGGTVEVTVQDATLGAQVPFNVVVEGASAWVRVTQSDSRTPETLTISFTAKGIQPGEYSGRIFIDASIPDVENDPLIIDLSLTVEAVVNAMPLSVEFVWFPCVEPLVAKTQAVTLTASSALSYTAAVEGNPDWVTIAPEAGSLPEAVRVTVDPAQRPADLATVDLLVTVDLPDEPNVVNRVPIVLTCPEQQLRVPLIPND
jgi:hypothetical protein